MFECDICGETDCDCTDNSEEINVGWTASHQSYYSAGDEAEAYCIDCDEMLPDDDWNYCPNCGN